jgi:hypothetical protein
VAGRGLPQITNSERAKHGSARRRTIYIRRLNLYRRRPQRLVEWEVDDHPEDFLLDTYEKCPSHATFEIFHTVLSGKSGKCDITMPPSVPRYSGQILKVAPEDFRLKLRMKNTPHLEQVA